MGKKLWTYKGCLQKNISHILSHWDNWKLALSFHPPFVSKPKKMRDFSLGNNKKSQSFKFLRQYDFCSPLPHPLSQRIKIWAILILVASLRFQCSKIEIRLHERKKHDNQKWVSTRWITSEDKKNLVEKSNFSLKYGKKIKVQKWPTFTISYKELWALYIFFTNNKI